MNDPYLSGPIERPDRKKIQNKERMSFEVLLIEVVRAHS